MLVHGNYEYFKRNQKPHVCILQIMSELRKFI